MRKLSIDGKRTNTDKGRPAKAFEVGNYTEHKRAAHITILACSGSTRNEHEKKSGGAMLFNCHIITAANERQQFGKTKTLLEIPRIRSKRRLSSFRKREEEERERRRCYITVED